MPLKKKIQKKQQKAPDPNKLTTVEKTFCELTIADLNQKIARLRAYLANVEESNAEVKEKIVELDEESTDVAAQMARTLDERNDMIRELEERLTQIIKVRDEENLEANMHIQDLESKYKAMHDQLLSQVKSLNAKLNSLEDFRLSRDEVLARYEDREQELRDKERAHKEALHQLERKALLEKDQMKKEVENKLLQVAEEFTRSSEHRNAGYTRRLIRENIALQKEIDILILSGIKMQQDYNEQMARNKKMDELCAALDKKKKDLIRNSQSKIEIVGKLTTAYEKLKARYEESLHYRKLYEELTKRSLCERFTYRELSKKLRSIALKTDGLRMSKNRLISLNEQHQHEIDKLCNVIMRIKLTLRAAIGTTLPGEHVSSVLSMQYSAGMGIEEPPETPIDSDGTTPSEFKCGNMVKAILAIIAKHKLEVPETPSLQSLGGSAKTEYQPENLGFVPRSGSSMMEIFKREVRKVTAIEEGPVAYELKQEDSIIIPKARSFDANSLMDVEIGSTLYVSSSHEALEIGQVEQEPLDDDAAAEEAESSDYQSSSAGGQTRKSEVSMAPLTSGAVSKRTSLDTTIKDATGDAPSVSEDSRALMDIGEEELDLEEEYSINLFY